MTSLRGLSSKRFKGMDHLDQRKRLLLLSQIAAETDQDYAATANELSSTWWDEDDEFPGEGSLSRSPNPIHPLLKNSGT